MVVYKSINFPKNFFRMGNINLFTGNPGIGKTHAVVYLTHNALPYGFNVLTNIPMFRKENINEAKKRGWLDKKTKYLDIPENFTFVPVASQLIIKASEGDKNIIVVDEAGITASSSKALGNTAVQMKFLGFSIRKIGACLINIAQDETSVVPTLRANIVKYKVNVLMDEKTGRRDLEFLIADKKFDPVKGINIIDFRHYVTLEDVPKVELPYDSISPGGFIFDINLEKLYNKIAILSYENNWDSIDIRKNIKSIVEDMVDEQDIRRYIKQQHFMRTTTVAKYLDTPDRTVRHWADQGILNAIKDPKGNWLFSVEDIKKYKKLLRSGKKLSSIS